MVQPSSAWAWLGGYVTRTTEQQLEDAPAFSDDSWSNRNWDLSALGGDGGMQERQFYWLFKVTAASVPPKFPL